MWKFFPLLALLLFACQDMPAPLTVTQQGHTLTVAGSLPAGTDQVEIQLWSARNASVSSYHAVSPHDPAYDSLRQLPALVDWNIFYPVVDVALTDGLQGVARFDTAIESQYTVNGAFFPEVRSLQGDRIVMPTSQLQQWENSLYLQPAPVPVTAFYLAEEVSGTTGRLQQAYRVLAPGWEGQVVVYRLPQREEIFRAEVTAPPTAAGPARGPVGDLSPERLLASLQATAAFTLRCQDRSPHSPVENGLNLFYDLDARTFRRPQWVWGWGPSIKLLLACAALPEVGLPADSLLRAAREIGEASLGLQEADPSHPAYGIITSRWSENKGTLLENGGFEHYYSIADAQFLAGWGWIPLYEATGDVRYLDGVKRLTETTGKLTQAFDIIPMDYLVRAGRWKDYALNEQGFGTEGINELYRVDPDPAYVSIGDAYMQMLLAKFDTEEGIWNRKYLIDAAEKVPTAYHCRGTGWAMEGLVAAYELTRKPLYLAKARKMADVLCAYQLENGSWSYSIKDRDPAEISEKGTALWSLLLYKLYRHTQDPVYLAAARRALGWCLDHQYTGPDPLAQGALVGISRQSGVVYRPWFRLACSYTSGFFGLAVLEELALQEAG